MKLRKILSCVVAGALALSAMTVTASAAVKIAGCDVGRIEGDNYIFDLVEQKLDYSQARSAKITLQVETEDGFQGCIMLNGAKCGWVQNDQGKFHTDGSNAITPEQSESDETIWTMTISIPAGNYGDAEYAASVDDFYAQIFIQEWWGEPFTVKSVEVLNESGKPVDTLPDPEPEEEAADDSAVDAADADDDDTDADDDDDDEDADTDADDDDEDADADDDDEDADTDADDDDEDADDDDEETEAPAAETPAAGDTTQASAGGSKDSPDTGAADVAVVAGLAVVAAGAALVAKKRK